MRNRNFYISSKMDLFRAVIAVGNVSKPVAMEPVHRLRWAKNILTSRCRMN